MRWEILPHFFCTPITSLSEENLNDSLRDSYLKEFILNVFEAIHILLWKTIELNQ